MKLRDFLLSLEHTSLGGIVLGGNRVAGITSNNHPEIISILNDTIQRIHTDYPDTHFQEIIVEMLEGQTQYKISPEFALNSNSKVPYKYIIDCASNPFIRPVMQIINAYNNKGEVLPINDSNSDLSIMIQDFDTIQVPKPVEGETICLICQVGPGVLSYTGEGYLEQEVDIPNFALYLAKLDVVAHVLMNRKTRESEEESNKYLAMYQNELARLKNNGYRIHDGNSNMKLGERGWL